MMMLNASTCLYKRTHKLVLMGRITFEDHVLNKKWWANEKMNVKSGMFKDEKK